ncbi:MAG: hypothetical protein KJ842_04610 [Candidatus Omnitrophica bacterium]|nr:hypothetical protein [Candidatus Omnitrophota bacterium]
MKILIVYATAGTGHRRVAQSLYDYLQDNCQNLEIKIIDALEKSNPIFRNIYIYGYDFLVNHALWLWQFSFWLTSIRFLNSLNRFLAFIIHRLNSTQLCRFLIQDNPDFIISTHFLPSEISASLKRSKKINSKIITVITDFGVHPFWVSEGTDVYVVPCGITKEQLILEGVKEDKIKEFGIPVELKFFKKYDRDALCEKLNIQKHKFTVLMVTGSFGIGPIEEIINLLYKDVQILAVCANNRRLYTRLKNKNYPNTRVYGFVDNIEELMAVSDVIITKPGGVSISEILAMELLPIFISAIPGQETQNAKVLRKYKIGISPKKIEDIPGIVLDYKEHPQRIKDAKENIKAIKRPSTAGELCNAICPDSIRFANCRPF